jgi:lipopolysaccharide export system permease protein
MVILAVSGLRLLGFASMVFTLKYPIAALVQYVAVIGTMVASLYAISRGLIIEQPAFLGKAINAISEWLVRRAGAIMKPAQ